VVRNVFLLTIDALGAEHVGHLGYDRNTTPHLDELSEQGVTFQNCFAQSSHTRESMPSLFFSAYPFDLGSVGPVPEDRPTIATTISDAGFATAGFHSNPYLSRAYRFERGFDEFDDGLPLARNRLLTFLHRAINHFKLEPYVRADDLADRGRSWLDGTAADRRFLWLHFMDPHGPYQPPAEYQRMFRDDVVGKRTAKRLWRRSVDDPESLSDADRRTLMDLYDAEIRYTDEMIGRFVDDLRSRGLLEKSLVVVAADHGEEFGEDGIFGHPRRVTERLTHVPLVVLGPSVPADMTVSRVVENVDIGPTICERCGVDVPSEFAGQPLAFDADGSVSNDQNASKTGNGIDSLASDGVAVMEAHGEGKASDRRRFALRTDDYRYRAEYNDEGELYDESVAAVSTGVDEADESVRERLAERLLDHVTATNALADPARPEAATAVDGVVKDRLDDLGYRE